MPLEWPTSILTGGVFQVGQLPGARSRHVSSIVVDQCPGPPERGGIAVDVPDDKGGGPRQGEGQRQDQCQAQPLQLSEVMSR